MLEKVLIFEEGIRYKVFPQCDYGIILIMELFDAFLCTNDYEHFKYYLYNNDNSWNHPDSWSSGINEFYNRATL